MLWRGKDVNPCCKNTLKVKRNQVEEHFTGSVRIHRSTWGLVQHSVLWGPSRGLLKRLQAGEGQEKENRMQGEQGQWRPTVWVLILPARFVLETSGSKPGLRTNQ